MEGDVPGSWKTLPPWAAWLLLLMPLSTGCGAVSLFVGVSEPDLAAIRTGAERGEAESHLGDPLWTPGVEGGLTYDIYQFEASRPANPIFGLAALFFDVMSFGLTEIAYADARKHAPVKQVAVGYDAKNRVHFVSKPWNVPRDRIGPERRMRVALPPGCGVPPGTLPPPVSGKDPRASRVAILDLGSWTDASVDGRRTGRRRVELSPGRHRVEYRAHLGMSILLGAAFASYDVAADVGLLAGHAYRVERERFYSWPRGMADAFWIEDMDTGEVLHCAWPERK